MISDRCAGQGAAGIGSEFWHSNASMPVRARRAAGVCWCHFARQQTIALIADQNLVDRLRSVALDVAHPISDVLQRLGVCHILRPQQEVMESGLGREDAAPDASDEGACTDIY